jgi:hypothetical protein
MSDVVRALELLAQDRAARDGLTAARAATGHRVERARERLEQARAQLAGEQQEVAALESFSMTRIMAGLRGRRDAELDRERAEAAAAEYAVAEAAARLATEQRELDSLDSRIADFGDLDRRHAELLARREEEVRRDPAGAATAERLTALAERAGALRARSVQLEEADAAAREAHGALQETARHLGSAGSWATYDTFFGGGLVGDMVKHDKLDRAAALMRRADAALAHLGTELADVGIGSVGEIGIGSMTRALDVWFDNIFSDWAVRDRIAQADDRVQRLLVGVADIGRELRARQQQTVAELADTAAERERLLTGLV